MPGGTLSRLYDFEVGDIIDPEQVDAELNQIITEINSHEVSNPGDHVDNSVRDNHLAEDSVLKNKIKDEEVYGVKLKSNRGQSELDESQLVSGTLSADPTNEDGSTLTDTGGGVGATDEHKNRIVELMNGTVYTRTLCKRYVIDSNTSTTIVLRPSATGGGNAYSAGFRSGAVYHILPDTIKGRNVGEREINWKHLTDELFKRIKLNAPIVAMAHRSVHTEYTEWLAQLELLDYGIWHNILEFYTSVPSMVYGLGYNALLLLEHPPGVVIPQFRIIVDGIEFPIKVLTDDGEWHWYSEVNTNEAFLTSGDKYVQLQVALAAGSEESAIFFCQAFHLYISHLKYSE